MNSSLLKFAVRGTAAVLVVAAAIVPRAHGQTDERPVTNAFAVSGATVQTEPGKVLRNATVVVRDGIITAVGTDVTIPYDARILDGDSLFVYAGFIDGIGHIGIPEPRDEGPSQGGGRNQGRTSDENPADPSNERAGIQPERSASDFLDKDDKSIDAFRKQGIAIAHSVPHGRMLPGQGSVVSLIDDISGGVVAGDATMFMQFQGARGVYPGTPMGIMAKFRNLYRQAELNKKWESNYRDNPNGIRRPPNDAALDAFFPVIAGTQPVVMKADDILTVYRALRLRDDLGFQLVLAGVEQASEMVTDLATSNAAVLLTLKMPEEKDKGAKRGKTATPDSTGEKAAARTPYNPGFRTNSYADVEAEAANLKSRRALALAQYKETAAALEKAGVPFGFSTMDIKASDFRKNLLEMVKVGLSKEAAVAALTTNPARILGIDRAAGTIASGKMGNLVISSGDYFDEKSYVKFMLVDGRLFEYDAPEKKKGASKDSSVTGAAAVAGTWRYLTNVQGEDYVGRIEISVAAGSITGIIEGDRLPETAMISPTFDSGSLSFDFMVPEIGRSHVEADIDGDSGSGTITLPGLGAFSTTFRRTSGPDQDVSTTLE